MPPAMISTDSVVSATDSLVTSLLLCSGFSVSSLLRLNCYIVVGGPWTIRPSLLCTFVLAVLGGAVFIVTGLTALYLAVLLYQPGRKIVLPFSCPV